MKKIFEKHESTFGILLIVLYVVINSYCMQNFGIEDYRSTIINTVFSIIVIISMKISKLHNVTYITLQCFANLIKTI